MKMMMTLSPPPLSRTQSARRGCGRGVTLPNRITRMAGVLDSNEPAESLSYPSWPSLSFNPFKSQSSSSDSGYHSNSSGTDSAEDSGAQGIHLLLRPPDLLTPSLPPPLPPFTQPTLTPPPPWDHVPFLEEAWGSGDYLETLSFMVPDGEELALATPLPNNPYGNDDEEDDDGGDWFSYNYAFPARPTIPLSSRLPLSPSSPTADTPLYTRPTHPDVFPTWDEDYDLEDMMPLEPTELLLPDMNSLEYYTNLLARERERNIDQERDYLPALIDQITAISLTRAPPVTTPRAAQSPPSRQYLCNVTKPEMYLVRVVSSKGSSPGFTQVKELLKKELNCSVELQFLRTPSSFAFRVVSGPLIFTAISVINALRRSARGSGLFPNVSPLYTVPDLRYQVHTVLQFVPTHVDIRVCNFSQRIERGLILAYSEACRRSHEDRNITVQLLNITRLQAAVVEHKVSIDITFAVRDGRDYLLGSDVSEHLRKLNLVEFSFYVGFPVLQIAELLLKVPEQQVAERSFKARLERRLALLLEEGLQVSSRRRWRRATAVGNHSLQVARVSMLTGAERPLEVFYFVEGPGGKRIPAEATAATMNSVDLQRAAIILGHRVQKPVAQPVETLSIPPAETQSSSIWLIVGVIVPVLLAVFIIIILYWKLCGSEKLEFQPDAINTIQQRQKLQAPSVKGFDFAKLHLGQHSKDDIVVIQEPGPLPVPVKEATPSDGGDLNTPKSKGSSNKGARSGRRRGRLSPSDGDSLGSDQSSGRESAEETSRPVATPSSTPDEFLSSTSIFDHVDRLSRGSSDGMRRQGNKVQLIAMQPQPSPPHAASQPSPSLTEKVALRHKSEIEHHRNKLRQRAKRRGQCEFPSMDDIMDAFGDGPVQGEAGQRLYSSAHDHMDCILPSNGPSPPTPTDSRRRGRSSPRGRRVHPGLGSLPDTDRDHLLTDQSATYRKYPGLNNVAYMSDPDLPPDHNSPSPTDEVFDPAPAPPPYMPPQPSIEEARQQMHSLLDDAFALVSPSSQGSAGVSRVSPALPSPSPQARLQGRQWGSYPAVPSHSPFSARYAELGMSPTSVQGLLQRQGLTSGGYVVTGDQRQESIYPSRGQYEEPPSSSRPRPVGGSTSEFSGTSTYEINWFWKLFRNLKITCTLSPVDAGGIVQSDRSVPCGGSQHVGPNWLQLEPAALRPGPVPTQSQQRECKCTNV
ncbi:UPF0606 protein KIAA1549 [Takifugu flavidus]|uniref:UPF0606 protein KIAA1549 n=1 Tax=Takifugu flavidus TaxID=433684 RepID=A0A5C6MFB4_9TELE|nr:UPF0606 protein KIAA1549 [Takifugu flavidus]